MENSCRFEEPSEPEPPFSSPPLCSRPTITNHDAVERTIEKCVDSFLGTFLEDVREAIYDGSALTVSDLSALLWCRSDVFDDTCSRDLPLEEQAAVIDRAIDSLESDVPGSHFSLIGDRTRERAEVVLADLEAFLDDAGVALEDVMRDTSVTPPAGYEVLRFPLSPAITLSFLKRSSE